VCVPSPTHSFILGLKPSCFLQILPTAAFPNADSTPTPLARRTRLLLLHAVTRHSQLPRSRGVNPLTTLQWRRCNGIDMWRNVTSSTKPEVHKISDRNAIREDRATDNMHRYNLVKSVCSVLENVLADAPAVLLCSWSSQSPSPLPRSCSSIFSERSVGSKA